MKSKIFSRLRNFMAALVLSAAVMCSGVGGSYFAVYDVYASGVLEVSIISSLIEALMASMGLSFSSTADLNNVVTGLDSMMESYPDYTYKGVKVFEKLQEVLYSAKLGATVALPYACIEWFSIWLYGTSSDVLSDASDVIYQNPSVSVPGVQFIYGDFSQSFFEACKLFYDLPLYLDNTYSFAYTGNEPIFKDSCPMVVTIFNREDNYFTIAYPTTNIITYPKSLDVSTVLGTDNSLIDSVFELYTSSGGVGSFKLCAFLHQDTRFKADTSYSTLNTDTFNLRFRDCTYDATLGYQNVYSQKNYLPASSTNAEIRVFVNSGTRFYESYEEYAMINMYSVYAPTSTVYGSSSASKELEKDEAAGTVSLQLTQAQLTETIEKAVADAIAANPSITEEELNEMVAEQVGALSGVQDSIEEGTSVLSGIMQKVLSVLEGLADNILNGLVSLVVPSEGFIQTQINNIMNCLNGMGIAPFDMSEIFTEEDESPFKDITIEIYGQEVVIVSFAHLDMFLDKFRPAIRGLIALFLIFYSIDQFLSLFSLGGMSEGGHVTSLANSLSSIVMPQGDSGRLGQKGELTKR